MPRTILICDKHSALRANFPSFRINLLRAHFSATPLFLYRYAFPGGGGYGISIPFVFYSLRNTPSASLYQRTTCPKAGGGGVDRYAAPAAKCLARPLDPLLRLRHSSVAPPRTEWYVVPHHFSTLHTGGRQAPGQLSLRPSYRYNGRLWLGVKRHP